MNKSNMLKFITASVTDSCPRFVRRFEAKEVRSAVLEVTGLGLYRAFLNGKRIGDDWLTPGFNDYDAYLRVQTYDISELLKDGENCLEAVVGDGWYKGRFGLYGEKEIWGNTYLLAARICLVHEDGSQTVIDTDEKWLAGASCIRKTSIYDGEVRDDTFEKAVLAPCTEVETALLPEKDITPRIRCKSILKASKMVSPAGEQILDFGQNMAGVVRFYNRLPKGGQVRLQFGEVLQEGCFYRDNLRSAKAEYVYTSDGVEKWVEPWFTYYGFRYVKVEGCQAEPSDFEALALSSDLKETLTVETDSPKLNRLMENALWGQRSNFLDVPTDCPQRDERLGWTADTQVFVDTACYHMDCREFYRKFLRDLRIDQTRYFDGDIPAYSPSLKGSGIPGGAVWADAATIIPWKLYLNYGDRKILNENYSLMQDYTELLIRRDKEQGGRHLVEWGFTFGDWLALDGKNLKSPLGGTEPSYIRTIYYWNSVRLTALAAKELGKKEDEQRYSALADSIREVILREYFTLSGHLWRDTQTAYVLALSYGLYRDREVLVKDFKERLRKDDFQLKCGFTGTPLLLPALLDNGLEDEAFRLLYNEEYPGWLYAVNLGATTIWERWNSMLPDGKVSDTGMNSFNHYSYGSVCGAIYSRIAGLRAEAPGWKSAVIEPHFHWRMQKISLRFQSPAGEYAVSWHTQEDDTVMVDAQVPEGAAALIKLPDREAFWIQSGSYQWSVQPRTSLLYPFSVNMPVADLMGHPAARKAVLEKLPFLENAGAGSELWARDLSQLSEANPNLAEINLEEVQQVLKNIRV